MKRKMLATAVFLLLTSATSALADLAPPPGYTRVSVSIVLEAKQDFANYRFFLVSSDLVKEVFIKKGEKTTVRSLGGGARYNSGTVVAIPRKSLAEFGENPTGEKLEALETAIAENRVAGATKLLTHTFGREVRDTGVRKVPDAKYRIEKSRSGLKAVPLNFAGKANKGGMSFGDPDIEPGSAPRGWTSIVAGVLMSFAVVTFGLWTFSRFTRKDV